MYINKEEFRIWLRDIDGRNGAQTSDHISRVKRIEGAFTVYDGKECDVEKECRKDNAAGLLQRLSLSSRQKMPKTINLPDSSMGRVRLKSSLRKYIKYYNWKQSFE